MTDGAFLLLGATGRVGGATYTALRQLRPEARIRLLSRSAQAPVQVDRAHADQIELVQGTANEGAALLDRALCDITAVLIVTGDHPDMAAQEIRVIEAAARQHNPPRVIKVSAITAGLPGRPSFGAQHGAVEDALAASGLAHVIIRPTFFFQSLELLADPIRKGFLPAATGQGRIGFVDLRDVAETAARALVSPDLDGQTLTVTGAQSLSMGEVAQRIGTARARPLRHVSPPRWLMPWLLRFGAGLDPWLASQVSTLMSCCAAGGEDVVTTTVSDVLGRSPRDLDGYLAEAVATFSPQ